MPKKSHDRTNVQLNQKEMDYIGIEKQYYLVEKTVKWLIKWNEKGETPNSKDEFTETFGLSTKLS